MGDPAAREPRLRFLSPAYKFLPNVFPATGAQAKRPQGLSALLHSTVKFVSKSFSASRAFLFDDFFFFMIVVIVFFSDVS